MYFTFRRDMGAVYCGSRALASEGVNHSGNCEWLVNPMHITASVFINDDKSGLHHERASQKSKVKSRRPL